jgi:hypothetical protein
LFALQAGLAASASGQLPASAPSPAGSSHTSSNPSDLISNSASSSAAQPATFSSSSSSSSSAADAPDSLLRSALKALGWRVFSTLATVGGLLLVLGEGLHLEDALKFGGLEFTVKFIRYFAHERLWATFKLWR